MNSPSIQCPSSISKFYSIVSIVLLFLLLFYCFYCCSNVVVIVVSIVVFLLLCGTIRSSAPSGATVQKAYAMSGDSFLAYSDLAEAAFSVFWEAFFAVSGRLWVRQVSVFCKHLTIIYTDFWAGRCSLVTLWCRLIYVLPGIQVLPLSPVHFHGMRSHPL